MFTRAGRLRQAREPYSEPERYDAMPMMTSKGDTVAAGIGYERSAARALATRIARQSVDSMRSTPLCANDEILQSNRRGRKRSKTNN